MHGLVFVESDPFSPIRYIYRVNGTLYSGKSRYQEILVLESPDFGKMLVLDGVVQLTERDEFFYHEMLAHVILHAHPNPRTILIVGGETEELCERCLSTTQWRESNWSS